MTFYYRDLSMELRMRKVPETRIAEILREVNEHSSVSGQPPEEEFGPAMDYAKSFPEQKGQTVSMKAFMAVLAPCLLAQAYFLFSWSVLDQAPVYVGPVRVTLLLMATQAVALVVAFTSNYRLPRGFTLTNDRPA